MTSIKAKSLILTLGAVIMASCSSVKTPTESSGAYTTKNVSSTSNPAAAILQTGASGWTDLKMPVSVNLKSPTPLSASGTMTMVRDRYVHVSLRMLGFEIASLFITNDSVFAADKYHKYYLAEPTAAFLKGFDASVGNIQALLLGHIFYPGSPFGVVDAKRMNVVPTGDADLPGSVVIIPVTPTDAGFTISFVEDTAPATPLLLATAFVNGGNNAVVVRYSDFRSEAALGGYASTINIEGNAGKTAIAATLQLKSASARIDSGATASWNTPRGYKRISGSELLKALRP